MLEEFKPESADFIHIFITTEAELLELATSCKTALKKNGSFWISWPKQKSPLATSLKSGHIRTHLLSIGLVDVKVAALDEDWSALKFMYRRKDR